MHTKSLLPSGCMCRAWTICIQQAEGFVRPSINHSRHGVVVEMEKTKKLPQIACRNVLVVIDSGHDT